MDSGIHTFSELFAQLGLPSSSREIEDFISRHAPLDDALTLDQAPFWNSAQAGFIREALSSDADWSELVDALNLALRRKHAD